MSGSFTNDLLIYLGLVLEVGLLVYILAHGHAKRVWELVLYLAVSSGVGIARLYTLHHYGFASSQYANCYWTTDLLLVLAAFVLVVSFFRRACSHNGEM